MKQSSKIESMITDLNLMDFGDDPQHRYFTEALDGLEALFIALMNIEDFGDGGRDLQQEIADFRSSR
ncbi:MAG: hypothetical protein ABJC88_16925 [Parasphingorhabdus sp.]|uniref:hypothetical protein n=1 Tax=Sphingomonadales TaxID=204457 RepID=UPI003266B814